MPRGPLSTRCDQSVSGSIAGSTNGWTKLEASIWSEQICNGRWQWAKQLFYMFRSFVRRGDSHVSGHIEIRVRHVTATGKSHWQFALRTTFSFSDQLSPYFCISCNTLHRHIRLWITVDAQRAEVVRMFMEWSPCRLNHSLPRSRPYPAKNFKSCSTLSKLPGQQTL
eukprot:6199490-Pleurochrysis_carterae.AAC.1